MKNIKYCIALVGVVLAGCDTTQVVLFDETSETSEGGQGTGGMTCVDVCPLPNPCLIAGNCEDPCDGVICLFNLTCEDGKCVCRDDHCPYPQTCVNGACTDPKDPCDDVCCPEGSECEDGQCVEHDPCDDVSCCEGQHCEQGECVNDDPCKDVVCCDDQVCVEGECVDRDCDDDNSCHHGWYHNW